MQHQIAKPGEFRALYEQEMARVGHVADPAEQETLALARRLQAEVSLPPENRMPVGFGARLTLHWRV
jgi:hypothetical protein